MLSFCSFYCNGFYASSCHLEKLAANFKETELVKWLSVYIMIFSGYKLVQH